MLEQVAEEGAIINSTDVKYDPFPVFFSFVLFIRHFKCQVLLPPQLRNHFAILLVQGNNRT